MAQTDQTFNFRDIKDAQLVNVGGTVNQIYQLPPREQNPIFTQQQHPQTDLIRAVHNVYVRGVLEDALRRVNPGFEIKLRSDPSAAGASEPYQHYQIAGNIRQIFTDIERKLLILGEPASGKTVLLLQLTEQLLQEAATDSRARVPVVVNLSSWAVKREPLDQWLVVELRKVYGASRKLSRDLIGGNRLIYMLDGLDEVAEVYRADCLDAINAFIGPDTQITVCSRITEYNALSGKLDIHNAVELQPLDRETFQGYLIDGGLSAEVAAELTETLTSDPDVWQQTRKPLFANILIDTYADRTYIPPTSDDANTLGRVYEIAIAPYITRQLDRTDKPYPDDKTRHYLAWMAWQMNEHKMTSFYGEALQGEWLHRLISQRIFRILFGLFLGLSGGLFVGLVSGLIVGIASNLSAGLTSALVFGLSGAIIGSVGGGVFLGRGDITIERRMSFRINQKRLIIGFISGLTGGLFVALIFGLFFGRNFGLSAGLVSGSTFGLTLGLSKETSVSDRVKLNQGITDSITVGLLFGFIGILLMRT